MAVRCAGAASGADLSPRRCLFAGPREAFRLSALCSKNFGASASSKAKTSQSIIAHMIATRDLISQYATELVNAGVDVIVTSGDEAVRIVQQATKTIPILRSAAIWSGQGW